MAVGLPLKTTYANGDVYSSSDVNDTNGTINAYVSTGKAAGVNKIINGDFEVWQRGTTFITATGGSSYTADRFLAVNESGANLTTSRQTFTPGTAPVAGYEGEYFLRLATTSATGDTYIVQKIEDVRTFAGQTVTISFWAKCNTGTVSSNGYYLQGFGTGGSTTVFANTGALTITTSWQRFSKTVAIPSVSGKTIGASSSLDFQILRYAASNSVDIWGVQVEAGSTATVFQTATGTIQGELAACQRYYYRQSAQQLYNHYGLGFASGTTQANILIKSSVTMRTAPTAVDFSTLAVYEGSTVTAVTSISLIGNFQGQDTFALATSGATGLTTYRPYFLISNNSTSGFIGFSAEL
jgi:hypothetical protein